VRPRGRSRPSNSRPGRRRPELAAAALLLAAGCASARLPTAGVVELARSASSWSGSLRVSVRGDELRGRSRALVAFRRPDAVRIEIPGVSGARLVAVTASGRLTAVLPAERAVLESAAGPRELAALIGIALAPSELMDVLVGVRPARARSYEAEWGQALPRRVRAELEDGTRLDAHIDEAEQGVELPAAAFQPPRCDGCRAVDADEARRLLTGGR
jgi:hypothetical protein